MPRAKRNAMAFLILTAVAIFVLTAALILLMTRPAWPSTVTSPQPYTCEDVRRLIAEKGKVKALTWAFEHGLSIRQIYIIRRTCKV